MTKQIIDHTDDLAIARLFVGRSIDRIDGETLVLDDGRRVTVVPNEGGCSCGAGDYGLEKLQPFGAVITAAEVLREDDGHLPTKYLLRVYAGSLLANAAVIVGDDGSGYCGTGFTLLVEEVAA